MQIVGFTGKRGHGKSTAAEALVRSLGYVHLNFADPLREVCHLVYGVSYTEMLDPVLKEQVLDRWPHKSPRELLQQIGTDMFRNFIGDTWIENWKNRAHAALNVPPALLQKIAGFEEVVAPSAVGVVCSDCRFLNEAEAIRALGGKIIKIEDPRKVRNDAASLHQSEMEIDQIIPDWTITNDRTIHDLELAARMLVE